MDFRTVCAAVRRSKVCVAGCWSVVLTGFLVVQVMGCTKDSRDPYVYQAPRRIGFSLVEWLKAHPEAAANACGPAPVQCTDYDYAKCPQYCDENGYQRTIGTLPFWYECPDPSTVEPSDPHPDGPHGSVPGYPFLAVLDLDYDYRVVSSNGWTPVKILRKVEVFDDRPPPFVRTGTTFVAGSCDADGVCGVGSGPQITTVLWSGVNLVFAEYAGGCCKSEPADLLILQAYPIESGKIYDWWGGSVDWSVVRTNIVSWIEERNKRYPIAMAHQYDSCANLSCNLPRSASTSRPNDLGEAPVLPVPDIGAATPDP